MDRTGLLIISLLGRGICARVARFGRGSGYTLGIMTAPLHDTEPAGDHDTTSLDVEMALFAMSASDIGGPLQDIDLSALSAEEKRSLLAYLRHRFNFAPDPAGLGEPDGGKQALGGEGHDPEGEAHALDGEYPPGGVPPAPRPGARDA